MVHWWRQFGLNSLGLVHDLQRLTRGPTGAIIKKNPPLIHFQQMYPVLFECLHAVFGLMMSNSRLCEQLHGVMQHNLRSGTGMDEVDARQTYCTGRRYEMRQERRNMVSSSTERPTKKFCGVKHSKTKEQIEFLSHQLVREVAVFERQAKELLNTANNGIPSANELNILGRRNQDKDRLELQIRAEREKSANNRREVLTLEVVREEAGKTELSNDKVMRLGEEKLDCRMKIAEMSTKKFWEKDLVIPEGRSQAQFIMNTAWKSFPMMHAIVYRGIDAKPDRTKGTVIKSVGEYLRKAKYVAKSIVQFMYGKPGTATMTPKRERYLQEGDILHIFRYFRVVDGAFDANGDKVELAALTTLSSFKTGDAHYTYTLKATDNSHDSNEEQEGNREAVSDDQLLGGLALEDNDIVPPEETEDGPRFVSVT